MALPLPSAVFTRFPAFARYRAAFSEGSACGLGRARGGCGPAKLLSYRLSYRLIGEKRKPAGGKHQNLPRVANPLSRASNIRLATSNEQIRGVGAFAARTNECCRYRRPSCSRATNGVSVKRSIYKEQ